MAILKKYQLKFKEGPVQRELATPTGVAILAGLKKMFGDGESLLNKVMVVEETGISAGNLLLGDRPNIFTIKLGNFPQNIGASSDLSNYLGKFSSCIMKIMVLETNLDDITGEISGTLINELISLGAYDVSLINTVTKKNRAGLILRAIVDHKILEPVCQKIFEITGTLGLRIQEMDRICLEREITEFDFEYEGNKFDTKIKIGKEPNGKINSIKIEYEDLIRINQTLNLPLKTLTKKNRSVSL